ncbi:MAG: hypothetical protein U1E52_15575 [Geminicoccaceae bacterium]
MPIVLWGFPEHEPRTGSVHAVELAAALLHRAGVECCCLLAAADAPDTGHRLAALLAEPRATAS